MSDESTNKKNDLLSAELDIFVQRALALGVADFESVCALIPDLKMQDEVRQAAEHNPVKGERLTVDDLVKEMELRAASIEDHLDEEREKH